MFGVGQQAFARLTTGQMGLELEDVEGVCNVANQIADER